MRFVTVLLLSTCFAAEAFAQTTPVATSATTPATIPTGMVNGKFQVGYEGRGDYNKSEKLEKQPTASDSFAADAAALATTTSAVTLAPSSPKLTSTPSGMPVNAAFNTATTAATPSAPAASAPAVSAPASTPLAAAPAPLVTPPSMHSDSALNSDLSQAKAAAASNQPQTAPATPKASAATTTGPMVLVGGQVQH